MATKILDIRYIGWVKAYPNGVQAANGWSGGGWTVLLLKSALFQHFGLSERISEATTLYNALGIGAAVDIAAIKGAYKRLAKQWHPDVCKERDARTQFDTIRHAYEILGDNTLRAKYDAGLALQESLGYRDQQNQRGAEYDVTRIYRTPLRCGLLLVDGIQKGAKFEVSLIHDWQDITNSKGQTLSTSWKGDSFMETWI